MQPDRPAFLRVSNQLMSDGPCLPWRRRRRPRRRGLPCPEWVARAC